MRIKVKRSFREKHSRTFLSLFLRDDISKTLSVKWNRSFFLANCQNVFTLEAICDGETGYRKIIKNLFDILYERVSINFQILFYCFFYILLQNVRYIKRGVK